MDINIKKIGTAGHLRQVIIGGKLGASDTDALLQAAHSVFCPDKVHPHKHMKNRITMSLRVNMRI